MLMTLARVGAGRRRYVSLSTRPPGDMPHRGGVWCFERVAILQ